MVDRVLVGALVVLLALRIVQAARYQRVIEDTLSALCTMMGEAFEVWREGR